MGADDRVPLVRGHVSHFLGGRGVPYSDALPLVTRCAVRIGNTKHLGMKTNEAEIRVPY